MAARRRTLRSDDLFRLKIPIGVDLAPDAEMVVFALKVVDRRNNAYNSHLYLANARGARPRQLTRGRTFDSEPRWSPDGRHIAYISKQPDGIPQVRVLPLAGGEPWQLTQLAGGPVRHLRWSPSGRALAFCHRPQPQIDPEQRKLQPTYKHVARILHKLDGDGFFPSERWHIWKVAFPGGRTLQITRGDQDDQEPTWSPDGRRIAFISNRIPEADYHPENSDLFVIDAGGRGLRRLTHRFGPVSAPAWSLDGRRLYYVGHYGREGEWLRHPLHIYAIPLSGGRAVDLTPKLDNWPGNWLASDTAGTGLGFVRLLPFRDPAGTQRRSTPRRGSLTRAQSPERLAFLLNEHGACRLYSLPAAGGSARVEFGGPVDVLDVAVLPRAGRAALAAAQITDCGDVFLLPLDGEAGVAGPAAAAVAGTPRARGTMRAASVARALESAQPAARRLTDLNGALLRGRLLSQPEEVIFGGARNKSVPVHGWILKPPSFRPGRRYPMVLYVHGGPMAQFGYVFFHELNLLAAQGYVVVFTNPRGSSGYGLRFMNCIENRWGTYDYDDLMAVVDEMVRAPYVDAQRLGVAGGSYGGFMTTWIVGHTRRFKAAVTMRQASNLLVQVGSSDFGFLRTYRRGSTPWQTPMKHLADSPNYYADRIRTPLLIIHSEEDLRCPIAQSEELFTFLKLQRKTVEMIRFEGESHGLSRGGKPQNRLERLERIVDWFARYL
jgi:dipeptidyl aminopeptidase/acylaminoacyl peptidase